MTLRKIASGPRLSILLSEFWVGVARCVHPGLVKGGASALHLLAMSTRDRKRPDESARPSYITREGYRRLEEEAHRLWTLERPKLTRAVAEAAAEGDRSENAEYIYGKRKLAEIDRRLSFLGKRLEALTIVEEDRHGETRVFFGAHVTLEDDDGALVTYRIVGPDETDAGRGYISVESPMAKALMGKAIGDEVRVPRPRGAAEFVIHAVHYGGGHA